MTCRRGHNISANDIATYSSTFYLNCVFFDYTITATSINSIFGYYATTCYFNYIVINFRIPTASTINCAFYCSISYLNYISRNFFGIIRTITIVNSTINITNYFCCIARDDNLVVTSISNHSTIITTSDTTVNSIFSFYSSTSYIHFV
ncbi:Uncharacterised protein [Campylobacter geochelonis]|uniref:Uncharacterized protein n=1 Tax=Campylobacter geochelonis TaxID=1780362 RepID=A0A128EQI7_9BACT|nr:Uncharacterised protein [Campylobacter geochelonis]CZE51288.1 Uncharacterised protein [Campylobacter geochelonis]